MEHHFGLLCFYCFPRSLIIYPLSITRKQSSWAFSNRAWDVFLINCNTGGGGGAGGCCWGVEGGSGEIPKFALLLKFIKITIYIS